VPLSVYCPEPGGAWPCAVVPLLVNVIQYPQPTAARCYALGHHVARDARRAERQPGADSRDLPCAGVEAMVTAPEELAGHLLAIAAGSR
jgi:hypothetical protein